MRILIAARQTSLRSALATLIRTRPCIEIVAIAKSKEELRQFVESKRPDLLLLDEDLDESIVDSVVIPTWESDPHLMTIILGQRAESSETYFEEGTVVYLAKDGSPKSLLTAIEEAKLRSNKYV